MISSLTAMFVTFREGFEAVFLTVLMLGASRSQGIQSVTAVIGVAAGLMLAAGLVAVVHAVGADTDRFVPYMDLCTALVLTYVVVWNARVTKHINEHLRQMRDRGLVAMLLTVTTIYFREGAEMALMLYGSFSADPRGSAMGAVLGLLLLFVVVYLARRGLRHRMDTKTLFVASNIMLGALALYFYAEAAEALLDSGILVQVFQ